MESGYTPAPCLTASPACEGDAFLQPPFATSSRQAGGVQKASTGEDDGEDSHYFQLVAVSRELLSLSCRWKLRSGSYHPVAVGVNRTAIGQLPPRCSTGNDDIEHDKLVIVVQNAFPEASHQICASVLRRSCSDSETSSPQSSFDSFSSSSSSSRSSSKSSCAKPDCPLTEDQSQAFSSAESSPVDEHSSMIETSSSSDSQQAADDSASSSIGSMQHAEGLCQPCCFFVRGICRLGAECMHCHQCHVNCRPGQRVRAWEEARKERAPGARRHEKSGHPVG